MTGSMIKPPHVPWVSPYITVRDVDKAVEFYKKAFHFEVKDIAEGEDGSSWHAELLYKDQLIMLGKESAWGSATKAPVTSGIDSPISLYLYTENVDEFYQYAIAHQAENLLQPDNMFWGDRMCKLKDLDGYHWCFATHLGSDATVS